MLITESEIKGMENTLSHPLAAMFMQGGSSSQNSVAGSSSSSNSHDDLPFAIVSTATPRSFYPTNAPSPMHFRSSGTLPMPSPMPQQFPSPSTMLYRYGFGFTGSASNNFNLGPRSSNNSRNSFGGQQIISLFTIKEKVMVTTIGQGNKGDHLQRKE
nr:uncharacterized protein LOC114820752 [Malus domestica]